MTEELASALDLLPSFSLSYFVIISHVKEDEEEEEEEEKERGGLDSSV